MTKNLKKYLKAIFKPIKYSKLSFSLYFLIEIFDSFQSVFVVVMMSYIISAIELWNLEKLYFWIWIFVFIAIIKIITSLFQDSIHSNMYNNITISLTKKYFKKYINLDNTSVESYWSWKMHNIIFKWTESIFNTLTGFISIIVEIIAIVYIFILVLTKVPDIYYFTGFSLLFFIVIYLFWKWLHQIVKIRRIAKENYIEIDSKRMKILMSKFEIFQNNKINEELNWIETIYKKDKKLWWIWNFKKNLWQTWSELILQWFYIVLFLVIWVWIINWSYDIATFALLVWILQILWRYAWQIRWYMRDITRWFIDIEKLVDVFESIPKYKDTSNLPGFTFKKWDIEFKNISFSYNEELKVLDKFSLKLEWWKKYAFVWESWWGKSTLIKLLAWYINPNKWDIIIDNQKISEVNLKSFYKNIGYLSQDPSVFDWTIIENLLYALDYVPDNTKIDEVIKLSKCEFIYDLQNKLETQIWEKWVRLSWWQKQRLAIAKIMLKNPKIILLDEPTSALDSFNEEQVSIAFKNLFKNKTVVVIAHRLQTVKNSDLIFYIKDWKIVEQWNHKELLMLKWNYYKMIELQSWF